MPIENAAKDAQGLGQWIAQCGAALVFYGLIDKFRRGGPVKEMGKRMDALEKSVDEKFKDLTSQRTRDVDSLKTEMTTIQISMAKLEEATKHQNDMLGKIWNKVEGGEK
jgi:hypothetical protein